MIPAAAPLFGATAPVVAGVLDARSVPKCESFSGKDEDWIEWSFTFRSYVFVLGLGASLLLCENLGVAPETVDMEPQVARQSELLYHLLVQMLKGKSKKKAMTVEVSNGFKLWYELKDSYERAVPGRHQSMLMQLLRPSWSHVAPKEFESYLIDWELGVQRYESQSSKTFDDDNKIAVVLMGAPEAIRNSINAGDPTNRVTYGRLRAAMLNLINGTLGQEQFGGPAPSNDDPMQVDALYKGGGKGKFKGKDKGKEKGKKGCKKGKVKGKKGKTQHFEGTCRYCEKYGHKEVDCWNTKEQG